VQLLTQSSQDSRNQTAVPSYGSTFTSTSPYHLQNQMPIGSQNQQSNFINPTAGMIDWSQGPFSNELNKELGPKDKESKESWETALIKGKFIDLNLVAAKFSSTKGVKRKTKTSVSESFNMWSQAWFTVMAEVNRVVPDRIDEFIQHGKFIADTSKSFDWTLVEEFDVAFRDWVEKNNESLATINVRLWLSHFGSNNGSKQDKPSFSGYCFEYNKQNGSCEGPCEYVHACSYCKRRGHPEAICYKKPGQSNGSFYRKSFKKPKPSGSHSEPAQGESKATK
jgi:hypothetical protein